MAENLNYEASGSKCYEDRYYPNKAANCEKYGKLYSWETAMKACPSGWHLPSNEEWGVLTAAAGGDTIAGKYLKAVSGWKHNRNEDKFGFSALPGGSVVNSVGRFGTAGENGVWWSSSESEYDSDDAYRLYMSNRSSRIYYNGDVTKDIFYSSVRCLQGLAPKTKEKPKAPNVQQKGILGTFTDTRDGKIYKTTKIGEQVWFAENLSYNASSSKCYDNKPENCEKYGRLYNWETAMKACPGGWHLPSRAEWEVLTAAVGGKKIEGKYLKAVSGWNDYKEKSGNGEDKYSFSALPGGYCSGDGNFYEVGEQGNWWISSGDGSIAKVRFIDYFSENASYNNYDKGNFLSVRCLQNTPAPPKGSAK